MAGPVRRLRDLFAQLQFREGRIVCLADSPGMLSRDMRIDTVESFLQWLAETVGSGS
jgi:hypothetical protein